MVELGLLIGELQAHMKANTERHEQVVKRLDKLDAKVEDLNRLRWRIAGGTAALGGFLAVLKLVHEMGK